MDYDRKILWFCVASLLFSKVAGQCSSPLDLVAQTLQTNFIESQNYPSIYTENLYCTWRISSGDATKKVLINIEDISLESNYDFLYIYDGDTDHDTLLYDSDVSTETVLLSSGQYLYFRFTTDYSVNSMGFRVSYITVDSTADVHTHECGDILTATVTLQQTVYFRLNGAGNYRTCTFDIETSAGANKLEITSQILHDGYISIDDGVQTAFPNYQNGYTFVSSGHQAAVTTTGGYLITYQEVDSSVTGPAYATTLSPDIDSCDVTESVTAHTGSLGYITTPGYSANAYPNNVYCFTQIIANNSAESVQIQLVDYDVLCCYDYLEVFDGSTPGYNSLGTIWATDDIITSSGDRMTIAFSSDNSGHLRGVRISYTLVTRVMPTCVPASATHITATVNEQVITSINYPSNYEDYRDDYWLITKPSATSGLVLDIQDLYMEYSSDDCSYDSLRIYDGPCTEWSVLHKLCGRVDPFSVQGSTGLYVLVRFSTDYSVTYSGFKMVVYTTEDAGITDATIEDDVTQIANIIVPIAIVGGLLIVVGVVIANIYNRKRKSRQKVIPGTVVHPPPAPPLPLKIMTTRELLEDLQRRYGTSKDKKPKIKRKQSRISQYQNIDEPGPSQADVTIHTPYPPHVVPAPPGWKDMSCGFSKPPFPPVPFLGATSDITEGEMIPTPVMPVGQSDDVTLPTAPPIPAVMPPTDIPAPSGYITPLEARALRAKQIL